MIGHIESFDADTQSGVIKSEDKFFAFDLAGWTEEELQPDAGDDVYFEVAKDNNAINVKLVGAYLEPPKAVKYKYVAALLSPFLLARFYLGYYKLGLAQWAVLLLTVGYGVLWGVFECALFLGGHINKDAKGRPLK